MRFFATFFLLTFLAGPAFSQTRADRVQAKLKANPKANWYEVIDTGLFCSDTFLKNGPNGEVAVLKGIAISVGPDEDHTIVFDTETMRMAAGFAGNVTHAGTPWDGKHGGNSYFPEDPATYYFQTEMGPGWAVGGDWNDPRVEDNGRPNGPLPDEQAEYLGLYRNSGSIVLSYTVGGTGVLEKPGLVADAVVRTLQLEKTKEPLEVLVSDSSGPEKKVTLLNAPDGVELKTLDSGRRVAFIPAGTEGQFHIVYWKEEPRPMKIEAIDLTTLTKGGPSFFPETIEVTGHLGQEDGSYAVDSIPLPTENPWESFVRFGAFDFFPDGNRVACSTWNGDVWIAEGIGGDLGKITWRRYASGLYQTQGLKIVDGLIYTQGRDQITRLHDLNDDGEADFYECFNNDVRITEGFHEFTFDLRTDKDGNFYFTKAMPVLAGGRGFDKWTPHNGSVLKISADGKTIERVAWGLRAPGGIGIGPHGEITTGENEGSYVPRCKITWSKPDGSSFHGVVPSVWEEKAFVRNLDGAPTDYERPLCWLPYYVDNSSGSQFWVPEDSAWKTHAGHMLHLSYGKSSVYRVLIDEVDGQVQGGVYRLPIELTTAAMRGRFHPKTGNLYIIGFRGWQTNGGTGFQRIRFTGKEDPVPTELRAHKNGLVVKFSKALDPEVASDPRRYAVTKWDYVWGPQYGSGRFSIDNHDDEARTKALTEASKGSKNEVDTVPVRATTLLDDGKTVFLYVPEMTTAMQMEIKMDLVAADKTEFRETIWNTIHNLRPDFSEHGLDLTNLPEIDTAPVGEPGVILSMAHGSTDDALVVDRLAITLDVDQAATPFIDPRRGREMVFEGNIEVPSRDNLSFKMDGIGWASLRIDGKTVAEGDLPVTSDPIELEAGPHTVFCNFRRTDGMAGKRVTGGEGRLQLLWSGTDFVWEPIPPTSYRHLPNAVVEAKDKTRHGRDLFAAVGCIRCHDPQKKVDPGKAMPELLETLPDFVNAGNRWNRGWVEEWVRKPDNRCPSVAPDDAAHIAAYLETLKDKDLPSPKGDAEKGRELAETLHFTMWAEELATEAKHTSAGLAAFLENPTTHYPDTTFPHLRLSSEEAADLAEWILSKQPAPLKPHDGDPAKGKEMVSKRCLVCHGGKDKPAYEFPAEPLSEMWEEEWLVHGCLSEEEGNAPELGLTLDEKQALLAFKNVDSSGGLNSLNRFVPHEYAARTMDRIGCRECHSGENELPKIDLAGEKLRDEWLTGLFHGDVLRIRPYQHARMPGFPSRAEALAKGLAHGAGVTTGAPVTTPDPALAEAGAQISGLTGYACITCHAAGEKGAIQAFEGQGPNLQLAGERLREDYYLSWMHWPQRFIPTTIMPKYTADKKTALNPAFFDGNAKKQFEALWQWMHTLEGAEKAPVGELH